MRLVNLPVNLSAFIGRTHELTEIGDLLLERRVRLVTLVGPGGIGKTRLAIEAGHHVADEFADGIYFVSLTTDLSANQVIHHVIETLPFQVAPEHLPHQQLATALSQQHLLLILDNFEHVIDHAGWIVDVLHACPQVAVLVTSREPLHLRDEWVVQVGSMEYPAHLSDPSRIEDYDAVLLFTLRAQQVRHDFSLADEWQDVVRICQLVEGMPLALELAAGWLRTLSPREIAAEIQHNLNILHSKQHDVEDRHRSIAAVFNQSWQLLTADEQAAFLQLTIFRSGFSRDVSQHVTDIDLTLLDNLISKSMVRRQDAERYDIHELLRQYGEARLEQDPPEHQRVLKQCATYYARFLHNQTTQTDVMPGGLHLDQLSQEIGNIQRALNYLLSQQRVAEISDSIMTLNFLYQQGGWLQEGHYDFTRLVEQLRLCASSPAREMALARALYSLAWWQHNLGQHLQAIDHLNECLALLDMLDDASPVDVGLALLYRSRAAGMLGDLSQAEEDLHTARAHFEKADWRYGLWLAICQAAKLAHQQGAYPQAIAHWRRALTISERSEHIAGQVDVLAHLALSEIESGVYQDAQQHLLRAVGLCREHSVVAASPIIMIAAASLLHHHAQWEAAAQLASRALAHRVSADDVKHHAQTICDDVTGRIDLALPAADSPAPSRYALHLVSHDQWVTIENSLLDVLDDNAARPVLTEREQEVLRMLVEGATNRQIALALGIAEGTVKRYTHHLFAKLNAQNRAEAVYQATDWGLI